MNTKKIVSATLFTCVSFAAVTVSAQNAPPTVGFTLNWDGFGPGFRVPVEAKVVKGAPFSAEIINESIQTLSDGNRIVQRSNTRIYRDSEGRVRREEDRLSPAISITDPVTGMSFTLDPENRVAWQTPNMISMNFRTLQTMPAEMEKLKATTEKLRGEMEKLRATTETLKVLEASRQVEIQRKIEEQAIAIRPAGTTVGEQVKVEQLPARDIEGVRADGTRRTTTIPAGALGNELPIEIVSEEWTSPDLKMLVMTERRDPRLGTSTYRVVNISRAEPDRYLFEVPSDYTVKETGMIRKTGPALRK